MRVILIFELCSILESLSFLHFLANFAQISTKMVKKWSFYDIYTVFALKYPKNTINVKNHFPGPDFGQKMAKIQVSGCDKGIFRSIELAEIFRIDGVGGPLGPE